MKLFVGLGNPEIKFSQNRHNAGSMAIDALIPVMNKMYKRKAGFSQKFLQSTVFDYRPVAVLAKPMKFMNDSGISVKKLVDAYKLDPKDLYIIHDDLDIAVGDYKIQFAKGPKVHNGIKSIEEELGTNQFWRIRVGIENRDPEHRTKGEDYVLEDFTDEEKRIIKWVIHKLTHEELFEDLRYSDKF